MKIKPYLRLAVAFLALSAAELEASQISYAVGDTIDLSLSDGIAFSFLIVAAPPAGIAGQSYIARDQNSQASAVVKPAKNGLRVMIDDFEHGKTYSVRIKDGVVESKVHEMSMDGGDTCGTCSGEVSTAAATSAALPNDDSTSASVLSTRGAAALPNDDSTSASVLSTRGSASPRLVTTSTSFPLADQKSVIDILVAFDRGAKAWVENGNRISGDTIEDFAGYAVDKMNMVLEKSQLLDNFCYRLVGVVEIDDQWDTIKESGLLEKLRTRAGALSKIGDLREKYGADTITLLIDRDRNQSGTSGQGFEYASSYTAATFDNSNYACNVCDVKTVYERYTMSHETGHNMGCGHSNRYTTKPGRYSYSYGYNFVDANNVKRYTIMAYDQTSPASGSYSPVPYFSTPDISPTEYGCALGEAGTNDNRQTLLNTHAEIAGLREHVVPYDWDVRFLDVNGKELLDGTYFYEPLYVTLTNSNPNATIYYTYDGSMPGPTSYSCPNGQRFTFNESKTITACAVVDGVAQSVRTVTFKNGQIWSGEAGQNGNGAWTNDSSVLAWDDSSHAYDDWLPVAFHDIPLCSSATVSVYGTAAPCQADFSATTTAYTFAKGTSDAALHLRDACFAPAGDLTFNVPVSLVATNFTSPGRHTVTFNAPFGTNIAANASYGHCTNMIVVGDSGTLVVAPGSGKTQTFASFNNTGNYYNTATLQIGEGTVVFNGPINGDKGLFGTTKIAVGDGGNLVFNVGGATGSGVSSTLTVANGGMVTFNEMEHMNRKLILDGGTVRCKRLDWMNGTTISATDDSSIVENGSGGYVLIRFADATVDVSTGATLTLDVPITTGYNTANYGFVKTGGGELLANREMSHTGVTVISNGTVSIGYSSTTRVGLGWSVASGATLKLKAGCSLAVPTLTLESGATLVLPATNAAPLTASGEVNVANVRMRLVGAVELSKGSAYPLVKSNTGVTGVTNARIDDLPALDDGLMWELTESGGILSACVTATLNIPRGESVNLGDVAAGIDTITGEGTLVCGAALPGKDYDLTNDAWRGTVAFSGFNNQAALNNFQCERYGNASSKIQFTNCKIPYLKNNNATFAGTIVLVGDNALVTEDGYSDNYNIFGALEGTGSMSFTGRPKQGYVFNTATNFTGSITVNEGYYAGNPQGRRIVFGTVSELADLPDVSASITVQSNATASIGGGATWYAYHGVEIGGTLLVKGANATLDCNSSAAMGLKLNDGTTLRFEAADASLAFAKAPSFTSGTNYIAFASGIAPTNNMCLVLWPNGSAPAGDFAFADSAIAAKWLLKKTASGLVAIPQSVPVSILLRYYGDDGWEDRAFGFNLPTTWVMGYYPSLETAEAIAAKYNDTAANGAMMWQCYMLGLDPTDATSKVSLAVAIENGNIHFTVNGLGETHALDGVTIRWNLRTSTNLALDPGFSNRRESTTSAPPAFTVHSIPDKISQVGDATSNTLFYKLIVTFEKE